MKKHLFFSVAVFTAAALIFSCSSGDDGNNGGGGGQGGVNSQSYVYCLLSENKMCLDGPFTLNDCNAVGGKPSNSCPYGGSQVSSSSSGGTGQGSGEYCIAEYGSTLVCIKNIQFYGIDCSAYNMGEYSTGRLSDTCPPDYLCIDYSTDTSCNTSSSSIPSSSSNISSSSSSILSSSSVILLTSSSQQQSSSSVALSSSSIPPSSSSVPSSDKCTGFVNGTKIKHYDKEKEQFCDGRDGTKYVYVTIGTQTWMAENLNYNTSGSKCYDNLESNCKRYGRLYAWNTALENTALEACPSGWHLPSDAEWTTLANVSPGTAGTKLKTTNGWSIVSGYVAGTDNYGFSALPGGYGGSNNSFNGIGSNGSWWGTESGVITWHRFMLYSRSTDPVRDHDSKTYYLSVRCLRD